ncbi:MAG TPA: O-antigen ligase family protein [Chitinophagales bacterium]|nr:O-antigen ligase family protein [Chitinophagales bacterium]
MLSGKIEKFWLYVFYSFSACLLATLIAGIYLENYYLLLIPASLLFVYLSVNDMKFIYFLLLFTIPLSIEVQLPNGFATDFPTEILIGGMMILFIAFALSNPKAFDIRLLKNPIIFLLIIHYVWILIATFYSSDAFVSIKYSLAKTWYIITFVFVTSIMIKSVDDFKKAFWWLLLPLIFTIIYTMIRHSKTDFAFLTVNTPMLPFFRNHVSYACTIAQMIPFTFLAITWYKKGTLKRRFLIFSMLLMLVAVYFSYTRSAWLALLSAVFVIIVIRLRMMKWALALAIAGSIGFFVYMGYNNQYLEHAPDFQTTVYHPELGEHLASTFEGKDISSAERIYRWVAGVRMWYDKPWTGYGPGNFYNFYKSYTVNSFTTYVSDNPERSSIHNYFLLVLTEQGIIGLLIFLALTICIFVNGQRIYHQTISKKEKYYVLAILLCLVIIYVNTFLSDLLETDKIGSFYFICIALLLNQDIRNRDALRNKSLVADSMV